MRGSALSYNARTSCIGKHQGIFHAALVGLILLAAAVTITPSQAATPKEASLVMDAHTGKVLYSRNADEYRYPASLTKVMTLYLLFEKLDTGKIKMNSPITMTPRGAKMPPSKLGLRAGQTLTVEDAILALITRSANDVASATGAFLAGTEDKFAQEMTRKARDLGMKRTTYRNASGLPNREQRTTARDQAILAKRIKEDFPHYYHYFSTEYFQWGKVRIRNHNRLLGEYKGTTGLKTGYTNASGFNLTATVEKEDKFLIGVVMGGKKAKTRDAHMVDILDRAFPRAIAMKQPANTSTMVASAPPPQPVARPAAQIASSEIVSNEDRAALLQLTSTTIEASPVTAPTPLPVEALPAAATPVPAPAPVTTAALVTPPSADTNPAPATASQTAPIDSMTAYAVAALRTAEGPVRQAGREIGNFLVAPANASISPDAAANPLLRQAVIDDPARRELSTSQVWRDGDTLIPEGSWIIQIGAFSEQADAVDSIRKALRAAPAELGEAVPVTIPVKTADNRTLYRSRFGGFEGESAAKSACGRLARQAIQCVPIPPSGWSLPVTNHGDDKRRG